MASPSGHQTMKPRMVSAIQAGFPNSSDSALFSNAAAFRMMKFDSDPRELIRLTFATTQVGPDANLATGRDRPRGLMLASFSWIEADPTNH